jgi:catechol 2,3-dioxygenase-like lactoylglutathione lyase family enzyme
MPGINDLQNQSVSPIRVAGIDHVVIRIVDLERMLHFYCDVLGCNVERRQDGIGLIQLRAGRALIDLVPVDGKLGAKGGAAPGPEGRNMDHLCLRLEKFDGAAITAYLEDKGFLPSKVESRYGAEGQGPSIYISDPEGNVVELKGSVAR